ncbi:MAG TPA: BlaI/MecI/CopY family transcriptional regulator [Bryobacteraceae bacterium]|nr:BlaI/MecI/CopY family transcriptional regulator [Bryobacteraceae bacterium]
MRKLSSSTEIPPPLELECLKTLWGLGEASVKEVREALASDRNLAYTTVMTVLERLVRRRCVERRKVGRSFVYSATLTRDCVRRTAVKDLVDTFFDGSEDALRAWLGPGENAAAAAAAVAHEGVQARLEPALL